MIKALLFDFGGVLVRTEDYGPRHAWDKRLGMSTGSVERVVHHSDLWIQAQLGRVSYQAYWDGVAEMLRVRPADIPDLRRDYFSGDRLNYKLVELLRDLKGQGYLTGLLSNETLELRDKLRDLKIEELFDHILISAQIGLMKPDVTAYRAALQALGVGAHETLFVDDLLVNVRAAQSLGIHAVLFRPETDFRSEIARCLEDSSAR